MFPNRRKKHLVSFFQSGTCLVALETHDLLRFLRAVICKWPVINVTLLALNIATQNSRLMGYFLIVLMKLLSFTYLS